MNYLKYLNISPLPMNPNAMLFHTRDDPFFQSLLCLERKYVVLEYTHVSSQDEMPEPYDL